MKLTIIGAAGVRTPLIVEAIIHRQERMGIDELALMDIDADHLEIIGALTRPIEKEARFKITRTTESRQALEGADFVITTFRVGGIESRVIDEQVPLKRGILGQETTGPGGFAMGMRSIPVLLDYVDIMREVCPRAWLINFANPAGMLTEALGRVAHWDRAVGICDAPSSMQRVAAAILGVPHNEVYLDYFGLNHLGWVRSVRHNGQDYMPELIKMAQAAGGIPGMPIEAGLIATLGMIPNEYLYYYFYAKQAVRNILEAEESRGEQIAHLNVQLFTELKKLRDSGSPDKLPRMQARYQSYMTARGETYMVRETRQAHHMEDIDPRLSEALTGEGYAGVALDLIEGVERSAPIQMILNIPNQGAVEGMEAGDVVEVPAIISCGQVHPLAVGHIPTACLGLMKQIKAYEQLTIEAAVEHSYAIALLALTTHPLVMDRFIAKEILDEYRERHKDYFPELK
jgi:6-phospho-beta-glucosidase